MMVHAFNPNTWEAKAEELYIFKASLASLLSSYKAVRTTQIILSKNKNKTKKKMKQIKPLG